MESTNEKKQWEVSEIQLSYKSNVKPSQRPKITGSKDCYEILKEQWDKSRIELIEQFKVIFTNRANRAIGLFEVSTGGIAGTVADARLIFVAALKSGASGFIISHYCHPTNP